MVKPLFFLNGKGVERESGLLPQHSDTLFVYLLCVDIFFPSYLKILIKKREKIGSFPVYIECMRFNNDFCYILRGHRCFHHGYYCNRRFFLPWGGQR